MFRTRTTTASPYARRSDGLFAGLFKGMLLYLAIVMLGGTLINTGDPLAIEAGRLVHTITLVDPAIHWSQSHGLDHLAQGLRAISHGVLWM